MRKLFLGGLSPVSTLVEVRMALNQKVDPESIISVNILRDASGKSRCFGFVLLKSKEILE